MYFYINVVRGIETGLMEIKYEVFEIFELNITRLQSLIMLMNTSTIS